MWRFFARLHHVLWSLIFFDLWHMLYQNVVGLQRGRSIKLALLSTIVVSWIFFESLNGSVTTLREFVITNLISPPCYFSNSALVCRCSLMNEDIVSSIGTVLFGVAVCVFNILNIFKMCLAFVCTYPISLLLLLIASFILFFARV